MILTLIKRRKIYLTCLSLVRVRHRLSLNQCESKWLTAYLLPGVTHKAGTSQSSRNGVIQFSAVDPDDLAEYFSRDTDKCPIKSSFFRESIPELRAIESKRTDLPKYDFYRKRSSEKVYDSPWCPRMVFFFRYFCLRKTHTHDDLKKIVWDIGSRNSRQKKKKHEISLLIVLWLANIVKQYAQRITKYAWCQEVPKQIVSFWWTLFPDFLCR